MQLNEFVEESLTQILDGVSRAQAYAADKGALVNPGGWVDLPSKQPVAIDLRRASVEEIYAVPQVIDFDVAVTITKGGKINVVAGIFGGMFGATAKALTEKSDSTISRIKSSIPIVLPRMHKHPKSAAASSPA